MEMSSQKYCVSCGETQPIINFGKNKSEADGLCRKCRSCRTQWLAERKQRFEGHTDAEIRRGSPDKWCSGCERTRPASEFYIHRSTPTGLRYHCWVCHAIHNRRNHAKRSGLPATLMWQEIGDPPENCSCCGIQMERGTNEDGRANSPSLDRIDPNEGYTKLNSLWICVDCNRRKDHATLDQMYHMADWLYDIHRERGIPCSARLSTAEQLEVWG